MSNGTKASGKNRKIGRNKAWCNAYRLSGKHEISHARRMLRHLKRFPMDKRTFGRYSNIPEMLLRRADLPTPKELLGMITPVLTFTMTTTQRKKERRANKQVRLAMADAC